MKYYACEFTNEWQRNSIRVQSAHDINTLVINEIKTHIIKNLEATWISMKTSLEIGERKGIYVVGMLVLWSDFKHSRKEFVIFCFVQDLISTFFFLIIILIITAKKAKDNRMRLYDSLRF